MLLRIQETFPKEITYSCALKRCEGSGHQACEGKEGCSKQTGSKSIREDCGKADVPPDGDTCLPLAVLPSPTPPPDVFIHSFIIISLWTCIFLFSSVDYNPLLALCIWYSNCSWFWTSGFSVLLICLQYSLSTFLLPWTTHFVFFLSFRSGVNLSSKEPWYLSVENGI